jgi:hypothetical protein
MTISPFGRLRSLTQAFVPGDSTISETFAYDVADNMLSRTRMPGTCI